MKQNGGIGMKRRFNVTGSCSPKRHYMVKLDDRLKRIKEDYVEEGSYFAINRGRQYGKTTTLQALEAYLKEDYLVFSLDFQEMPDEKFENGETFARAFLKMLCSALRYQAGEEEQRIYGMLSEQFSKDTEMGLDDLFDFLGCICRESRKLVVLMIDEVDSAGNNQVFIQFLAQMRARYLKRDRVPTFHSVILAGVYDIKNLKLKLRPEEEHQYNSPWNVAADFDIDMSFSPGQIAGMLEEYEADYGTGMDIQEVSGEIYQYTSGYPYLVSAICKLMDEKLPDSGQFADEKAVWTRQGIAEAVNRILKSGAPLFGSLAKQLDTYRDLREMAKDIIYQGKRIPYSALVRSVSLGMMFGYFKEKDKCVSISNRIFEMAILNMFITEEASKSTAFAYGDRDRNQFTEGGRLNMELVLRKFVEHFSDICGGDDEKFIEAQGRKFFLLYLKPIINGTGNYYIEAQTRDAGRTDVIVDYLGEQFIVELKIWHGREYNQRGERQLTEYLDYFHKEKGYMLSFNFNKNKKVGVDVIRAGGKTIVEAVV